MRHNRLALCRFFSQPELPAAITADNIVRIAVSL